MKLFDDTFTGLERALDLRFKRHMVLSSNVANSETPKYRARELDFAGQLEKAFGEPEAGIKLEQTNPGHMDLTMSAGDYVTFDTSGAMGADGNNVDLDIQMGKISSNGRSYEGAASLMTQKLRLLRSFIRRGAA